jgi:hypothetical protein
VIQNVNTIVLFLSQEYLYRNKTIFLTLRTQFNPPWFLIGMLSGKNCVLRNTTSSWSKYRYQYGQYVHQNNSFNLECYSWKLEHHKCTVERRNHWIISLISHLIGSHAQAILQTISQVLWLCVNLSCDKINKKVLLYLYIYSIDILNRYIDINRFIKMSV